MDPSAFNKLRQAALENSITVPEYASLLLAFRAPGIGREMQSRLAQDIPMLIRNGRRLGLDVSGATFEALRNAHGNR